MSFVVCAAAPPRRLHSSLGRTNHLAAAPRHTQQCHTLRSLRAECAHCQHLYSVNVAATAHFYTPVVPLQQVRPSLQAHAGSMGRRALFLFLLAAVALMVTVSVVSTSSVVRSSRSPPPPPLPHFTFADIQQQLCTHHLNHPAQSP